MDYKYFWKYLTGILALITIALWAGVYNYNPEFKIIACNVGQGDAILAMQGNLQILVDGGPNDAVLNCLNKYIPFWDREIELVVLSHPQEDHYKGLINVFQNYSVENYLSSGIDSGNDSFRVLKDLIEGSQAQIILATTGKEIRVGKIHLDILWPDITLGVKEGAAGITPGVSDISSLPECKDPNDCSVILNLTYGSFTALLTGDIGPAVLPQIIANGLVGDIDYLKVPHHGSKNGLTQDLLDITTPEIAVISVGEKNRFGHPHKEVLGMLTRAGTKILRTDEVGDVVVETY